MTMLLRVPAWYEKLDRGIQYPVKVLHAAGIDTSTSCEGGIGHGYFRPTVILRHASSTEGFRAFAALRFQRVGVYAVSQQRIASGDDLGGAEWLIELERSLPEKAIAWPTVVWHYEQLRTMGETEALAQAAGHA